MWLNKFLVLLCLALFARLSESNRRRPNIVVIMADDLGWNDVSFHDRARQIPTPNIDALGLNGVILNKHYTQPGGISSRSAFMTGEYPTHTGTQHLVIEADQPWGLPLNRKLLPEHLRDVGYLTYLVGKWNLGFWKKAHTPLQRGFDHHYGSWGGTIDYWTKTAATSGAKSNVRGRDFRNDYQIDYDNTTYVTDLLTDAAINYIQGHPKDQPMFLMVNHFAPHAVNSNVPLQAPAEEIAKFDHIKNQDRKVYAAMVSKLDEAVGKLVLTLKQQNVLDNTIILFLSDNGSPTKGPGSNSGSNYPFKGQKLTPWEGGVRVPALIWSPLIHKPHRVSDQMIHITDWVPTLLSAAGAYTEIHGDGVDQWASISFDQPSNRRELLVNINTSKGWGAIIRDGWKLVKGTESPDYNAWLSGPNQLHLNNDEYVEQVLNSDVQKSLGTVQETEILDLTEKASVFCGPIPLSIAMQCKASEVCLFNLNEDKCEYYNVAAYYPQRVKELSTALMRYVRTTQLSTVSPADPDANPAFYNNTWTYWGDLVHAAYNGLSLLNLDQFKGLSGFFSQT